MDDNFIFDDEEFERGAGISELSDAYVRVFENIKKLADEGISTANAGIDKSVLSITSRMLTKISALKDVSDNIMAKLEHASTHGLISAELSESDDEYSDVGNSEDELIEKLNNIVSMNTEITYDDALSQIEENNKNIQDNGTDDFGDDVDW